MTVHGVKYDGAIATIERIVNALRVALDEDVTFGYIGNINSWGDDRSWMIFFPHPGRAGTDADHIGGFATGDTEGALRTVTEAYGALRMAKYLRSR